MEPIIFDQKPLSIKEQILELETKYHVRIVDKAYVERKLNYVTLYRIKGYLEPFKIIPEGDLVKEGTTFSDVWTYYKFDRELRSLVADAIERIEIAVRTVIIDVLSEKHGSHWLTSGEIKKACKWNKELTRNIENLRNSYSEHNFTQKYTQTYDEPADPPSWMTAEIHPFGTWSLIYNNLNTDSDDIKHRICRRFNIYQPDDFAHCLSHIKRLRNRCSHHNRLGGVKFRPVRLSHKEYGIDFRNNNTFYPQAVIIRMFLNVISPSSEWSARLQKLLIKYEPHNMQSLLKMGFPDDWKNEDKETKLWLWKHGDRDKIYI